MKPDNWNVVVRGHWNPAILTPAGIARRLFLLADGTPVDINVPIDGLGPYRVRHGGHIVVAEADQLVVATVTPDFVELDRARQIAIRAIQGLPETPVSAAGFNVRFETDQAPTRLLELISVRLDEALSAANLTIQHRSLQRAIAWRTGVLNLTIKLDVEASVFVEMNFHRASSRQDELVDWLQSPAAEVEATVLRLMEVLGAEKSGGSE